MPIDAGPLYYLMIKELIVIQIYRYLTFLPSHHSGWHNDRTVLIINELKNMLILSPSMQYKWKVDSKKTFLPYILIFDYFFLYISVH